MVALPFSFPCCGIKRGPYKPLSLNGGLAPEPFVFISSLILLVHPGIGLIEVLADDDAKSTIILFS